MTFPGEVPILTYHSLDDTGSPVSTSPALFRRQVELLREGGFETITVAELLAAWDETAAAPDRPIVVTFDDGLSSVAVHAAPVLREAGFRATVFAVAGRCGSDNDWPGQPAWVPRQKLLTFHDLRELAGAGWQVGSHGLGHTDLSRLPADRVAEEVGTSKQLLEDNVGVEVSAFAYPYGRASRSARALVAARYRAACSDELGFARQKDDRFRLRRIDAYYLRNPALFRRLLGRPARTYLGLRALGRRLRRRTGGGE